MAPSDSSHPKSIHLCTLTLGQQHYETVIAKWCSDHPARGYQLLVKADASLAEKLQAVRECDICLLVLGPEFGHQEARSLFSHAELEAAEAVKRHNLYVLVEREAESHANTQEQYDFLRRVKDFKQGWFANNVFPFDPGKSEEWKNRLYRLLDKIVEAWHPPTEKEGEEAYPQVNPHAIMICSTGMMGEERTVVRESITRYKMPVIDYTRAGAEAVTPRSWVIESARQARAIFLLMGPDYGSDIPFEGLGATELEFEHALDARVPVFAFLRFDAPRVPHSLSGVNPDQAAFVQRVCSYVPTEHLYVFDILKGETEAALEQQIELALRQLADQPLPVRLPDVDKEVRLSWYHQRLQRWVGKLPHLTRKQGVPLEQVYITLQTLPNQPAHQEKESEAQLAFASKQGQEGEEEQQKQVQTLTVEEALQQFPRLILQGNPGSGKSVALHWYALIADEHVTPIFVPLASYARMIEREEVDSLEAFLVRQERRMLLIEEDAPSLWLEQLREGRGLLLLDALDEVPPVLYDRVVTDIRVFSQQLFASQARESRIVLTTRIVGFRPERWADLFMITEVQPLTLAQQRQLIRYWYRVSSQQPDLLGERTQRIVEIVQRQASLYSWARTPLMLTLLTTLAAVTNIDFFTRTLTKAEIYRLSLRLMLGQWSTLSDRFWSQGLRQKELVLLALAWENTREQRRELVTRGDVERIQTLISSDMSQEGSGDAEKMLDELSRRDGVLIPLGEHLYTFYHPTFQEYLVATHLAALPEEERRAILERHRLNEQWEEITQLLVSELDRSGQFIAADAVIETLIAADAQPIHPCSWSDPLHLSLARAARCQGGRSFAQASGQTGRKLAQHWGSILQFVCQDFQQHQYLWEQSCQALLDMGVTAAYSYSDLEDMFQKWDEISHQQQWGRPLLPVSAIEALGNVQYYKEEEQNFSDVSKRAKHYLYQHFLKEWQRQEEIEAALKALFRLGSEAVAPVREKIVNFVNFGLGLDSKEKHIRELAATLLLQLSPTIEEIETIALRVSTLEPDAIWATLSLEFEAAKPFLESRIRRFSGSSERFDYKNDTDRENRAEALEVVRRLGTTAEPLLETLLYPIIYDIERNQHLAEEIFISFGVRAAPILAPLIENRAYSTWFRKWVPEISLQDLIYEPGDPVDEHKITEYLETGIHRLRQLEMIYYQRLQASHEDERDQKRIKEMQEVQERKAKLHQVLRDQPFFQDVRAVESYEADAGDFLDDLCFLAEDTRANHDARSMALRQLEKLGPQAKKALPTLCRLLRDPHYCFKSFNVLDAMKFAAEPALEDLLQCLSHSDWRVQARAIRVISRLGPQASKVLPHLAVILRERAQQARGQNMLRQVVIEAMEQFWPLTESYLDVICQILLLDSHARVRCAAAKFLEQTRACTPSVLETLSAVLQDAPSILPATDVQEAAERALAAILSSMDTVPSAS